MEQHKNNISLFKQNRTTFILLFILLILVLLVFLIGKFFPKKTETPPPVAIPTGIIEGGPEIAQEAEQSTKNYYPLAPFSPPADGNFFFLYTGRLKLKVYLKGNASAAKKEFEDFTALKGVDLSSHQIQYISP